MLRTPDEFFEAVREERYREPSRFLLQASAIIAFFTSIMSVLGFESMDRTSTYQAQILCCSSRPEGASRAAATRGTGGLRGILEATSTASERATGGLGCFARRSSRLYAAPAARWLC